MQIKPVTDEEQFLQLRDQWNSLADDMVNDSIFFRHEWFDAAWQWLKLESELLLLTVSRNDKFIGLWPLIVRRTTHRKMPVRIVEFLAIPDTQVCDAICAPENCQLVVNALDTYLSDNERAWDLCRLQKLPSGSPTVAHLQSGGTGSGFDVEYAGSNPHALLSGTWQEYYARRSRRLKKGNNLVANRLKKAFSVIEVHRIHTGGADEAGLEKTVQTVIDLSGRSWKSETDGCLQRPGPRKFIEKLTSHAARQGWLSIWILELDGQPSAAEYQISYMGHVYALRADFDDELSKLSPGTYLNWKLLESLFDEELLCYHMGPGDNAYKMRWTDDSLPLSSATTYSSSVRGRLLSLTERTLRPLIIGIVDRTRKKSDKAG